MLLSLSLQDLSGYKKVKFNLPNVSYRGTQIRVWAAQA